MYSSITLFFYLECAVSVITAAVGFLSPLYFQHR